MKVLFLNPPFRGQHFSRSQRSPGVIKSGTMYYPYWLAHAAALSESRGHEIMLVDAPADGLTPSDVCDRIADFSPALLVADTSTPSYQRDLETISLLKARFPNLRTCLVGTHVTMTWAHALTSCPELDFVCIGEYDEAVSDLLDALDAANPDFSGVAALAHRDAEGQPVRGPGRLPLENMDSLPWIAPIYRRFLTIENYRFTIATHPMVMLIGGRGCPAKCFYCVYPQVMHGHQYRVRSPAHLVNEMRWIEQNMPEVREIVFEDDTFTGNRKWALEVARLRRDAGVRIPWFANVRTNIDAGTLEALHDSGLRECATGFESGDDLLLKNMRKGQTVETQERFMEHCRRIGILVHGCFMVGFPGETRATMEKTLELAIRLNPDSAQFYPVMPYPGTGAYQWAKDNGYLATEDFEQWLTKDGGHRCVLNLPALSPGEIEEFCESAVRRFHFRPTYALRKLRQALTHPREGLRSLNAGWNFLSYLLRSDRHLEVPFRAQRREATEGWTSEVSVPKGRMERIENLVRLRKGRSNDDALSNELVEVESAAHRP